MQRGGHVSAARRAPLPTLPHLLCSPPTQLAQPALPGSTLADRSSHTAKLMGAPRTVPLTRLTQLSQPLPLREP